MEESLDWFTPDDREKVEWKGEPKLNSIYPSIAVGILLIPFGGLGLLVIAFAYLNLKNTHYIISNKAIYKKTGVVSRKVKKVGYEKIQDTSYKQGVFGQHFDYGDVEISTAGGSRVEMNIRAVDNPRTVQKMINKKTDSYADTAEDQGSSDQNEVVSELKKVRAELEEINKKLD